MRDGLIERVVQWLLKWVRTLMINQHGKLAVLLVGHCFIRPSDFVLTRYAPIRFKRFGWLIPAAPASLYAAANVALIRHFTLYDMVNYIGPENQVAYLRQYFRMETIMSVGAFSLIMIACYISSVITFLFHKLMCILFGQDRTDGNMVSLKFFLVRSSASFALFSAFSWLLYLFLSNSSSYEIQNIVNYVSEHTLYLIIGATCIYLAFRLCRANSRMAMQQIYLDEQTYGEVQSVALLIAVTALVIMSFIPRFLGIDT